MMKLLGLVRQFRSRFSLMHRFYIGITLICHVLAVLLFFSSPELGQSSPIAGEILFFILLCATCTALVENFLRDWNKYILALIVHVALVLCAIPLIGGGLIISLCLYTVLIMSIGIYNSHPMNLIISLAVLLLLLVVQSLSLLGNGKTLGAVLLSVGESAIFGALLAFFCSLMTTYRERYINMNAENMRLDALIDRLSRANLEYQEYANSIHEASTEAERKRITRDIHDIVGYTLTNNITMMEAVTDIMRVNPLGVASIVRAARENAEEGLDRIREALHMLRAQEVIYPTGIDALERMIATFKRATFVASTPSITGIRTSIRMMSGFSCLTKSRALEPFSAIPITTRSSERDSRMVFSPSAKSI